MVEKMTRLKEIPKLKPSQFDEYLFGNWKPKVSSLYSFERLVAQIFSEAAYSICQYNA
jgi:hypothetical protein